MDRREFSFCANATWLDFVDTELICGPTRVDLLPEIHDLAAWAEAAGLIEPGRACSAGGAEVLAEALALRAELRRIALTIVEGVDASEIDLEPINAILTRHPLALRARGTGWRLAPPVSEAGPNGLLVALAADLAGFLTGADLSRLRRCANPHCGYVFYDTSKNGTRRWCSMEACGNRAKAAQHRARRSSAAAD